MPTVSTPFSLMEYWAGLDPTVKLMIRLTQNRLDANLPHVLGDFIEANYPGYEAKEWSRAPAEEFFYPEYGQQLSSVGVFAFDEESDGETEINGYAIVAERPGGFAELVVWENFIVPVTMNAEVFPFGIVIDLGARYFVLPS